MAVFRTSDGHWKLKTDAVQMAASVLCEDRGHGGKAGHSTCGVCFNDCWPTMRPGQKQEKEWVVLLNTDEDRDFYTGRILSQVGFKNRP